MCNDSSTRVSQGGSTALLESRDPVSPLQRPFRTILRLQNFSSSTYASFHDLDEQSHHRLTNCLLVIHRDGDLRACGIVSETLVTKPMHSFRVVPSPQPSPEPGILETRLDKELQIGVGEEGVIGRRVCIYEPGRNRLPIAEGILGWN